MKLFELYADLSLDASSFNKGIASATKAGTSLAGTLKGGIGGAAQFVGNQVSATTIMLGNLMADVAKQGANVVKQVASVGIDYNRQMETYATNFTTMLGGSASAAEKLTTDLEDMAAATPFAMTDLADATQTLLQFGQDSDSVLGTLQSLGDIAMGDSNKLQSLTLAFAQASSSGKLMGQDLMQMINAGFNPLQTIVDKTGASMADLKEFMSSGKASDVLKKQMQKATEEVARMGDEASDGAKMLVQMAEDGAISAELLGQIFNIETSPGGKFYKAMENASKTFNGMVSTLEDDTSALIGKVMEPAFDFMTDTLLPKAIAVVGELDEAYDLGGLTGMASKATDILNETLGTWGTAAFDAGSGMMAQVLSGLTGDTVNKEEIKDFFTDVATDGSDALNAIVTTGGGLLKGIYDGLMEDGENETNIVQKISGLWDEGKTSLEELITAGKGLMGTIWQGITGEELTAQSIGNKIAGVFKAGGTALSDVLTSGQEFFTELDAKLGDPDASTGQKIASVFVEGLDAVQNLLGAGGQLFSNLYKEITNDTAGAAKLEALFDAIFADSEEWKDRIEPFKNLSGYLETARESAVALRDRNELLADAQSMVAWGPVYDYEGNVLASEAKFDEWSTTLLVGPSHTDYAKVQEEILAAKEVYDLYQGMGNLEMWHGMEAIPSEEFGYFDGLKQAVEETNSTNAELSGVVEMMNAEISALQNAISGLQAAATALANKKLSVFLDGRSVSSGLAPYSDEIMAVPNSAFP